ncbi:MAG: hypothetical protein KC917_19780, partial [Candidatus Omnitrophica bacterium]|nr:hypothetical protein [Candidatus Omnitrophota bacterium]
DFLSRNLAAFVLGGFYGILVGVTGFEFLELILFFSIFIGIQLQMEYGDPNRLRVIQSLSLDGQLRGQTIWFETVLLPVGIFSALAFLGAIARIPFLGDGEGVLQSALVHSVWLAFILSSFQFLVLACRWMGLRAKIGLPISLEGLSIAAVTVFIILQNHIRIEEEGLLGLIAIPGGLLLTATFFMVQIEPTLLMVQSGKWSGSRSERPHTAEVALLDRMLGHPIRFMAVIIGGTLLFMTVFSHTLIWFGYQPSGFLEERLDRDSFYYRAFLGVLLIFPVWVLSPWRKACRVFRALPISREGLFVRIVGFQLLLGLLCTSFYIFFLLNPFFLESRDTVWPYGYVFFVVTGLIMLVVGMFFSAEDGAGCVGILAGFTLISFFPESLQSHSTVMTIFLFLVAIVSSFGGTLAIWHWILPASHVYRSNANREYWSN